MWLLAHPYQRSTAASWLVPTHKHGSQGIHWPIIGTERVSFLRIGPRYLLSSHTSGWWCQGWACPSVWHVSHWTQGNSSVRLGADLSDKENTVASSRLYSFLLLGFLPAGSTARSYAASLPISQSPSNFFLPTSACTHSPYQIFSSPGTHQVTGVKVSRVSNLYLSQ